jgi:hypothetical protein
VAAAHDDPQPHQALQPPNSHSGRLNGLHPQTSSPTTGTSPTARPPRQCSRPSARGLRNSLSPLRQRA